MVASNTILSAHNAAVLYQVYENIWGKVKMQPKVIHGR